MNVDANLSALSSLGWSMAVSANNIANVNTEGFKSSRADLETGPGGQGVGVAAVRQSTESGPLQPKLDLLRRAAGTEAAITYVEGSNTDMAAEMVNMMSVQRAFEANVAFINVAEQTKGAVLDIVA